MSFDKHIQIQFFLFHCAFEPTYKSSTEINLGYDIIWVLLG